MATIGQQLLQPESGWRRYDDKDSIIQYVGSGWTNYTSLGGYNGSINISKIQNDSIRFNFTGTKLRIISLRNTDWGTSIQIIVDGVIKNYSAQGSALASVLMFEELDLDEGEHFVEIKKIDNTTNLYIGLDAVDVDVNGELLPYNENALSYKRRIILKNPTTNQHYSLADKTLISLPDGSDETIIEHGIGASKEIKLDEDFDKINHIVGESTSVGEGRVFKKTIDNTSNIIINVSVQ